MMVSLFGFGDFFFLLIKKADSAGLLTCLSSSSSQKLECDANKEAAILLSGKQKLLAANGGAESYKKPGSEQTTPWSSLPSPCPPTSGNKIITLSES